MTKDEKSEFVCAENQWELHKRIGKSLNPGRMDELKENVNTPNRRRNHFRRLEDIRDEALNNLGNISKRLQIMIITDKNALSDPEDLADEFERRGINLSDDMAA